MDIDFAAITEHQRDKLMASLIVPRPIALVTTLGETGVVNAAPFSLFNMLGEEPRDDLIDTATWRVKLQNYFPVARFGASFYVNTRERFTLEAKQTAIDEIRGGKARPRQAAPEPRKMAPKETAMTDITFNAFEAEALAQGFDEVLPREWASGQVVGEHRHPFSVRALVVQGEMWLTVGAQTRHLLPGDTFELTHAEPHSERYGAEGATYWAARRTTAAPA